MTDIKKEKIQVLISEPEIAQRIKFLGQQISDDFAGEELCVICVLKGSFVFAADLIRKITVPLQCYFISASSYGNKQVSSGEVKISGEELPSLRGKNVLIVEDIVDTGLTLQKLLERLGKEEPKKLKTTSLLLKPDKNQSQIKIDYLGFEIENKFVVGYGLDDAQYLRELPFIGIVP